MRILIAFGNPASMRNWPAGEAWMSPAHVTSTQSNYAFRHADGSTVEAMCVTNAEDLMRMRGCRYDLVINDTSMRSAFIEGLSPYAWEEFVRTELLTR